jgi:hypothetical protein
LSFSESTLKTHMKNKLVVILLLAGIAVSCNSSKKTTLNNSPDNNTNVANKIATVESIEDGKSFETAIVIREKSETSGVHAEYQWIREHFSNYKVNGQSLSSQGKKPYDIITIEFADGSKQEIYFDISNFYGRY